MKVNTCPCACGHETCSNSVMVGRYGPINREDLLSVWEAIGEYLEEIEERKKKREGRM